MSRPDTIAGLPENDERLNRKEVEGGLRLAFTLTTKVDERLLALERKVDALTAALTESGQVRADDLAARVERGGAAAEAEAAALPYPLRRRPPVVLLDEPNKYGIKGPDIDCAALMHLCEARCCSMTVFLSAQDLDERVLAWDYAHPYALPQREDSYCRYCEPGSGRCSVYMHRPAVCRQFDCRKDARIWKDFDARILAD